MKYSAVITTGASDSSQSSGATSALTPEPFRCPLERGKTVSSSLSLYFNYIEFKDDSIQPESAFPIRRDPICTASFIAHSNLESANGERERETDEKEKKVKCGGADELKLLISPHPAPGPPRFRGSIFRRRDAGMRRQRATPSEERASSRRINLVHCEPNIHHSATTASAGGELSSEREKKSQRKRASER